MTTSIHRKKINGNSGGLWIRFVWQRLCQITDHIASDDRMIDEMERIWKEMVMA
jgi:hypothetical protein